MNKRWTRINFQSVIFWVSLDGGSATIFTSPSNSFSSSSIDLDGTGFRRSINSLFVLHRAQKRLRSPVYIRVLKFVGHRLHEHVFRWQYYGIDLTLTKTSTVSITSLYWRMYWDSSTQKKSIWAVKKMPKDFFYISSLVLLLYFLRNYQPHRHLSFILKKMRWSGDKKKDPAMRQTCSLRWIAFSLDRFDKFWVLWSSQRTEKGHWD